MHESWSISNSLYYIKIISSKSTWCQNLFVWHPENVKQEQNASQSQAMRENSRPQSVSVNLGEWWTVLYLKSRMLCKVDPWAAQVVQGSTDTGNVCSVLQFGKSWTGKPGYTKNLRKYKKYPDNSLLFAIIK